MFKLAPKFMIELFTGFMPRSRKWSLYRAIEEKLSPDEDESSQSLSLMSPGTDLDSDAALRITLHRQVLDSYAVQFDRLERRFQSLDEKAQTTTLVGGIFLAVFFAFLGEIAAAHESATTSLVLISPALLLVSILAAIFSMKIPVPLEPPAGDDFRKLVYDAEDDFSPFSDSSDSNVRIYGKLCIGWSEAIESLVEATRAKVTWVLISQWTLAAAITVATLLGAVPIVFSGG